MRIVAGSLKGRRLEGGTWAGLRPTSDKLRETLFNVLGPRVEGARVLDGYAGTGALGLEALSRGATHVSFIERNPRAVALIRTNAERCGVAGGCAIIRASFAQASGAAHSARKFDLVLLDPPYDEPDLRGVVESGAAFLGPGGWLVLEHSRRRVAPGDVADLMHIRDVRSGDSELAIYERSESRG